MKITHMLPLALLALAAGCSNDETARPDPTNIRVFNAAPNFESLTFVREERPEAQLTLGAGQALSFDSGEYEFKVDHAIVGSILPVRAAVVSANLLPNRDYIFIPVSPGSQIEVLLVETDDDPNSETTSRVTFVHAHPAYAGLDVYMVEADIVTGCNLVASQPRGQISFGPNELAFDLDPGIYRICLTAPGDATDLRFESLDIPLLAAGINLTFIAYDEGGRRVSDLNVAVMDQSSSRLSQFGLPALFRYLQSVDDGLARDVYHNDETTPILPAPLTTATLSDYVPISIASNTEEISVKLFTPGAGDPDGIVPSIISQQGLYYSIFFAGDTTTGVAGNFMLEDTRSIVGQATLQFIHAAGMQDVLNVYIRTPGTDTTGLTPSLQLVTASVGEVRQLQITSRLPFPPGNYEITVRDLAQTLLAGPEPLTLTDGGVYRFLFLNDAVNPSLVDIRNFDDLAP